MYIPAQRLGAFLESYASLLDLNVWTESSLNKGATYDETSEKWCVYLPICRSIKS